MSELLIKENKYLGEVVLIRPIATLLIVVLHAFTMYGGGWILPEGISNVRVYFWIARLSNSFALEMFVFLSGYLFAHQIYNLRRKFPFKRLVKNKFNRLIIPSIVFSILYSLLIYTKPFNIVSYAYDILMGLGHMWFLPMLFWCFVFSFFIFKINIKEEIKLIFLFCISICSFIPLPLRLNSAMFYLLFFYLGFYVINNKQKIINKLANKKGLIVGTLSFVLIFIVSTLLREHIYSIEATSIINKAANWSVLNFIRIILATTGLLLFYVLINYLIEVKQYSTPQWVLKLNMFSFGIYLFHQFVLKYLYYETFLPMMFGTYWLPIVGLVIALIASIGLSNLFLKTSLGKSLIG